MKSVEEKEVEKLEDREEVEKTEKQSIEANPDPITGEPGSHPVGVATGGTGGAVAGAAVGGAVGGPVGAAVGAAVGAVAGGLAGKGAAEAINPSEEDVFWRENYRARPYYREGTDYVHYEPAYRFGWEAAGRPEFENRNFEEIENQLATEWPSYHDASTSDFGEMRQPAKDAYERARNRKENKS